MAVTRAPGDGDCSWLVDAARQWFGTARWKGGASCSDAVARHLLWHGVELQEVAVDAGGRPIGLVQLSAVDLRNGHASLDLLIHCHDRARPSAELLAASMVTRAFLALPLRKVYLAVFADAIACDLPFEVGATLEGRLVGHAPGLDGGRRDLLVGSFHRADAAVGTNGGDRGPA
jgi:hypothetical protein